MNADAPLREARIAIFPGSFDPITLGHEDVARRALAVADHVVVAVGFRASQPKKGLFDPTERIAMINEVFHDEPRIEAAGFEGLLVDFARSRNARIIIRGVRDSSDFEYEFRLALMNRELDSSLETIFLAPDPRKSFLSASLVREISELGGDVSRLVPTPVFTRLRGMGSGR